MNRYYSVFGIQKIFMNEYYSVFGNVSWTNNVRYSEIVHERILFGIQYSEIFHERILFGIQKFFMSKDIRYLVKFTIWYNSGLDYQVFPKFKYWKYGLILMIFWMRRCWDKVNIWYIYGWYMIKSEVVQHCLNFKFFTI